MQTKAPCDAPVAWRSEGVTLELRALLYRLKRRGAASIGLANAPQRGPGRIHFGPDDLRCKSAAWHSPACSGFPYDLGATFRRQSLSLIRAQFQKYGFVGPTSRVKTAAQKSVLFWRSPELWRIRAGKRRIRALAQVAQSRALPREPRGHWRLTVARSASEKLRRAQTGGGKGTGFEPSLNCTSCAALGGIISSLGQKALKQTGSHSNSFCACTVTFA